MEATNLNELFTGIADAIRAKDGTTEPIAAKQFPERISAIEGGGGGELPPEAYIITGDCGYRFANNGWNWYIDLLESQMQTNNITACEFMFSESNNLESIPFDINLIDNYSANMNNMFSSCNKLKEVPNIVGTIKAPTAQYSGQVSLNALFRGCSNLRNMPYDYFNNFLTEEFVEGSLLGSSQRSSIFDSCHSLRELPDLNRLRNGTTSYSSTLYYSLCNYCSCLNKVENLPIATPKTIASNMLGYSFTMCSRIKDLTFKTKEDGSPEVVQWKSQVIDLSQYVGYTNSQGNILDYNSGITAATEITDDTTYQQHKDNEDSWTMKIDYSRYNHDSVVRTINSLPDTSAYLASAGGTNTIKFKGASGSLTDGGAINTLTEQEIAVAAAKGWTVTLV